MDSRAAMRVDMGFFIGMKYGPDCPARVLIWDPCPFGLPEILAVAHVMSRACCGASEQDPGNMFCSFDLICQPMGELSICWSFAIGPSE